MNTPSKGTFFEPKKEGVYKINVWETQRPSEDDKFTFTKIIDTMLTKKKFKEFFNKNVASL